MHQYYKINGRVISICALLLFLCFVSWSCISQSFSYLSSSSSPLFFKFTSVHTFLQKQITVLECQPLEWDHQTSNVVDCKKKKKMKTWEPKLNICVFIWWERSRRRVPRERQFIQSVKKNSPVLSCKTSCKNVVYIVCAHGSMSVWQQRCHQPSPIWVH